MKRTSITLSAPHERLRRAPFGTPLFIWLGIGLLLLTLLLVWRAVTTRAHDERVAQTFNVLRELNRFDAEMLQAPVAARAPQVSPDERWRAVENHLREARRRLDAIATLVQGDPEQSRRTAELVRSLKTIAASASATAGSLQPEGLSDPAMLALMKQVAALRRHEQAMLATRQEAAARASVWFWLLTTMALALNLSLIWQAAWATSDYVHERNRREASIAELNAKLEQQMREIRLFNESLEGRVRAKTAELEATVDRLRQSNAELERFSYIASHHLQEPVREVAGFVDLVNQRHAGQLGDTARTYLASAMAGTRHLQAMLRGLQQYTALVSAEPVFREFVARPLLQGAVDGAKAALATVGGRIEWQVPGELKIVADPALLRRLLQALLANAIAASRPGFPLEIHITLERNATYSVLSVRDNGSGIEPRFRSRVFEMFATLPPVAPDGSAAATSVGAGLAIARRIALLHRGELTVEANEAPPEPGCTFRLIWPSDPAATEERVA